MRNCRDANGRLDVRFTYKKQKLKHLQLRTSSTQIKQLKLHQEPKFQITCGSICLSHMSLTVHPAPRITNAPAPKSANKVKSGKPPVPTARPQVDGQNSSHVPKPKVHLN